MVSQLETIEKTHAYPYNEEVLDFEWTTSLDIEDICGIDEAGRGPLAGPVTAAAVVLPRDFPLDLLGDSKKLTERQRLKALEIILSTALSYAVGWAWPEEIDRMNIHNATLTAMERAFRGISVGVKQVFVDGKIYSRHRNTVSGGDKGGRQGSRHYGGVHTGKIGQGRLDGPVLLDRRPLRL